MSLQRTLHRVDPPEGGEPLGRTMLYLCLQAMRQGQASFTHANGIVDGLRTQGWCVRLVEPGYRGEPGPFCRLLSICRIQLHAIGFLGRVDLAYVRWHWASLPFVLAAKLLRKPVAIEVNGTDEDFLTAWPVARRVSWLIVSAARWQLRHADALIAVTVELAAWVGEVSGGRRVAVIPNAADTDMFAPAGDLAGDSVTSGTPDRYVVFVGALAPWQGVDVMLESASLPGWPDGVSLVIAGDGARRAACEQADDGRSVRYLGPQPHARIPGLLAYAIASISVQTPTSGRGEVGCSPIKIFEGLASGRPVIVSDLPGLREVVLAEDCGIVVPPGDPDALAEAVAILAGDPDRSSEMGRRARDAAVQDHSWAARARATSSFLSEVLPP